MFPRSETMRLYTASLFSSGRSSIFVSILATLMPYPSRLSPSFSVSSLASSPSRPEITSSCVRLLITFFNALYTLELILDSAFCWDPLSFWINLTGSSIRHNTKQSEIMDFLSEVMTSLAAKSLRINLLVMTVSDWMMGIFQPNP